MSTSLNTQDLSPQIYMENDPVKRALEIPEILSNILSYLPTEHIHHKYSKLPDIKATRLVNSLWKVESEIYFKQCSIVKIDFYRKRDVTLEQFLEFCKSHNNFMLSFYPPYLDVINNKKKEFINFFSSQAPSIKFLRLYLEVYDSEDFKLKINLLSKLSYLKELVFEFNLSVSLDYLDIEKVFQEQPTLPFVTKLGMEWTSLRILTESDLRKLRHLSQKLLSMTPNLEELKPLGMYSIDNIELLYVYIEEIVELQREWKETKSKDQMPFNNLKIIKNLEFDQSSYSERFLISCLELSQPLKGLDIRFENKLSKENESNFQSFIEKNSTTLETLGISLQTLGYGNVIKFPDFPRLTRLTLYPFYNSDAFNIRHLFMMGALEFNSKFPKLHSLKLYSPENFRPWPNCQLDLSFPQFTSLEIWDFEQYYGNDKEWAEWLSKLFPNVHNPWINKARKNLQTNI